MIYWTGAATRNLQSRTMLLCRVPVSYLPEPHGWYCRHAALIAVSGKQLPVIDGHTKKERTDERLPWTRGLA
jgi:hypothetical protein